MELRHLELIRQLAARGSLSAVAEATHRTPSAVSQQLRTAERELGLKLVEPLSRGVRLTDAGQLLADGAEDISRRVAELRAKLDASVGEPRGTVSIGTLPSAGEALLPRLLRRLRGTGITVHLDDFDLAEAEFASQTLDADIVIGHSIPGEAPQGSQGLISTLLVKEPLDLAVAEGHPLAAHPVITPEEAAGHPWIGVPEGYPFDAIPTAIEQLTGVSIKRVVHLRDNHLVESLVAEDLGVALLPRFTARPRAGVMLRPITGIDARRSIVALSRPERYARLAVQRVTQHLAAIGTERHCEGGSTQT